MVRILIHPIFQNLEQGLQVCQRLEDAGYEMRPIPDENGWSGWVMLSDDPYVAPLDVLFTQAELEEVCRLGMLVELLSTEVADRYRVYAYGVYSVAV